MSDGLPIRTVGYGNRSVSEVMELVRKHGAEWIVDVRTSPYSKFSPGFSRDALESTARKEGFKYLFLGAELGGRPDDPTCYMDGKIDYEKARTRPAFVEGLGRLKVAAEKGISVCLLCSELRPQECHRAKLIGVSLTAMGILVEHIDEAGAIKGQREVMSLLEGPQLAFLYGIAGSGKPMDDSDQVRTERTCP